MNNLMQQQLLPTQYGLNQQMPPQNLFVQQRNYPTLYVGNLEEQINEEMLYKFFYRFGNIFSIRVMRDRTSKNSRGFAYISFYQQKDAEQAKTQANHEKILKNELRVTWKKNLKEVNKDANVIIKNLDESITGLILEENFSQFGSIFSSIVCFDQNGKSRGYGYVQFDTVESAQKAISGSQDLKIKEKTVEVEAFKKKSDRTDANKNLYFKNLPSSTNYTNEQVKELLDKQCSAFGEIESSCVQFSETQKKYFAFVSFKEKESAQKCLDTLKDSDVFVSEDNKDKLFVVWHQTKDKRQKVIRSQYNNTTNETNLFTKNLKPDVSAEQLKKVLEQYGVIDSVVVKKPDPSTSKATDKVFTTQFGFVNFLEKEDAKKAIELAKLNVDIQSLYEKEVFLTYHLRKEQFKILKEAKSKYKKNQQNVLFPFDPFFFGQISQMFWQQQFNPMVGGRLPNGVMRPQFVQQQGFPFPMMGQAPYGMQQGQVQNRQYNGSNQNRGQLNKHVSKVGKSKSAGTRLYQNKTQQGQNNRTVNQRQQQPQQQQQQTSVQSDIKYTKENLKEKLNNLISLEKDQQRVILGEILYPLVYKFQEVKAIAPRITGMLIDLDVFDITDIIEIIENEETLKERIQEAVELIKTGGAEQN